MEFKASIDKSGRVALPKPVLKETQLARGDELFVESDGDCITLRPVRPKTVLKKEFGIWVYQGQSSSQQVGRVIDKERKKRLRELF
jgi:bifunctional DNA-binding transcriptional regulator/antitoxin component of YhaV-PrlF toxin-antitoxin module